jgi:SAM-dependent methyltransferase
MAQEFDKDYWEAHWEQATGHRGEPTIVPNPYLASETSGLVTGSALDAGCGEGAEAILLASAGWQVTAVDISTEALSRAAERASAIGLPPERVHWVEADLGVWEPDLQFDLVTTHYAHPAMPQLDFYQRISNWVAPGGTLLIVGHLHSSDTAAPDNEHTRGHGHGQHHPPAEVSVTAARITSGIDPAHWEVGTAEHHSRTRTNRAGREVRLDDVVVRATRNAPMINSSVR